MIRDFQNFIDLVPGPAKAFLMLGVSYLKTCNYPAATYNLTRALELEPGLAGAYSNRAEAYLLGGKYEQAIEDATSAIRIGGDSITLAEAYRIRVLFSIRRQFGGLKSLSLQKDAGYSYEGE
jgi:tetratricopeptide (TPR) repeat protein